jgi:hypothetical protein
MNDWKLSSLPIVELRGWGYHEAQHRRQSSKAAPLWRSVVRLGVATIGRLLATS